MKLTAPPPGSVEESPAAPPVDTPPDPAVSPPAFVRPPEKTATWPTWFIPADYAIAILTLAVAFFAASFAAKNSDLWLHLASGQRLTTGDYHFGHDPFSYSAGDRTWVNHNWLFDLGLYVLYSGTGTLVVVLKAAIVALAFAALFAIRRTGQPLWPWAVCATLAILASTAQFVLRPYILSLLFLALTLLLTVRLPSRPGSWKLPLAIGVLFCLWSNTDAWFILGPFTLALLYIGQSLRGRPSATSDDPLELPNSGTLGKALVIGVLACMVNPHLWRVWELPFELLGNAGGGEADPRIRVFFFAPYQSLYWRSENLGQNACGIAYALLLLSGLYAVFLSSAVGRIFGTSTDVEPVPLPHLLLWVAFAALSIYSWFAIPFFALVTVPMVATRFNLFSQKLRLGLWNERGTRYLLTGSAGGRGLTVLALLILGVLAWPGWLHPPGAAWWDTRMQAPPALARRVEWKVEADTDLQRTAEWLNEARAQGKLPADTRGLITSLELANYVAWFAPQEKVLANSRLAFHRPEMPDYVNLRRGLGLFLEKGEQGDPRDAIDVLKKWDAQYVAVAQPLTDTDRLRGALNRTAMQTMMVNGAVFSPWYLNGRSMVAGYRASSKTGSPTFAALELDPEVLAFGPDVKRIDGVNAVPPVVIAGGFEELFAPRKPTPDAVEEAFSWLDYKTRRLKEAVVINQTSALLRLNQPGIRAPNVGPAIFEARDELLAAQGRLPPPQSNTGRLETPVILAYRAARRAIAEDPNHPDGYFALMLVLNDRDMPLPEGERAVGLVTAAQQCLARLPQPADFHPNQYLSSPTQVARTVTSLLLGQRYRTGDFQGARVDVGMIGELSGGGALYQLPAGPATGGRAVVVRVPPAAVPQLPPGSIVLANGLYILPLDIARQTLALAEEYAKVEIYDSETRTAQLKEIGDQRKIVDAAHQKAVEEYNRRTERMPKLLDRHDAALRLGLVDEAIKKLHEADLVKEFGEAATGVAIHLVALELAVGRLEDANADLASVHDAINAMAAAPRVNQQVVQLTRRQTAELEVEKLVLEGNLGEAGTQLESLFKGNVGKYPAPNMDQRPYETFGFGWPALGMFTATDTPLALITRYWGGYLQWVRYSNEVGSVSNTMQVEAEFFYRRGLLALLEGDIAGAKARFLSSHRPVPAGWKVREVRHRNAEVFLKLIEAGQKSKTP